MSKFHANMPWSSIFVTVRGFVSRFSFLRTFISTHSVSFKQCLRTIASRFLLLILMLTFAGCSTVYKGTGDLMISYADDEVVPYLLTTEDVDMACTMTEAFSSFFFSFETVTNSPDELKILLYMMAGQCSESRALESQLQYIRAVKQRNSLEAKDARIIQKRHLNKAAQRYYLGYNSLVDAYGEPGTQCPELDTFNNEMYWLMGLLDGLLALFSDMASESASGIPLDIANKIARGADCLDNTRWFGIPESIQAAVWATSPGAMPEQGIDPLAQLAKATEIGKNRRVRLAHILEAQVYLNRGDLERVKEIIRDHAIVVNEKPADPAMKLLDRMAHAQLLAISDQLWSEATGHRTPWLEYGTFWDDSSSEDEGDLDIGDFL